MKQNMINIKQVILLGTIFSTMVACQDWNEVYPLRIKQQDMENQNPELYAAYLQDLRAYKASDHSLTFGWFDNSVKNVISQGQHILAVPDSLDYLVLTSPDNLVERETEEINNIQRTKGTKVLYEIDVEAIRAAFEKKDETDPPTTFHQFLEDSLHTAIAFSKAYPYDGVIFSFLGKNRLHLTPAEITEIDEREVLLFDAVKEWKDANPAQEFIFKGLPQFVGDTEWLGQAKYIIVPTDKSLSKSNLTFQFIEAIGADIPKDRFIALANLTSYKLDEASLGYFADGSSSSIGTAEWVNGNHSGFTVKGIGLLNLQYDYYNILKSYQASRQVISILNPPLKK